MKQSEILRKAADSMRKGGFDPRYMRGPCGCFCRHLDAQVGGDFASPEYRAARQQMADLIGRPDPFLTGRNDSDPWFGEEALEHEGWTTDDAVAALNIAADIAECEGK